MWELTVTFYHGGSGDQTQVVRHGGKPLYPLSLHTGPHFVDLSVSVTLTYYQAVLAIACKKIWLCFGETSLKASEVRP